MTPSRKTEPADLGQLLSPAEVSRRLGVPQATLSDWRYRKRGPGFVRFNGKTVRYPEKMLAAWVRSNLQQGAA